jgi:hypothetical protein
LGAEEDETRSDVGLHGILTHNLHRILTHPLNRFSGVRSCVYGSFFSPFWVVSCCS